MARKEKGGGPSREYQHSKKEQGGQDEYDSK
jgi:hypothetical protein